MGNKEKCKEEKFKEYNKNKINQEKKEKINIKLVFKKIDCKN
jgi:hypothetical protein